jgi:prolyl oligopeptidase
MAKQLKKNLYECSLQGFWLVSLVVVLGCATVWTRSQKPPETATDNVTEIIHGVEIADPYRWLEDRESRRTEQWLKAQNNYTDAIMRSLAGREEIQQRAKELMRIDQVGNPIARNGRYFFHKRLAEQELSVICMRHGLEGQDEALVDPHPMSPDHTTSAWIAGVSDDGTVLAYWVQKGGRDERSLNLLDIDKRTDWPDHLPEARYHGFSLKPDKTGFYHVRHSDSGSRVYYHATGTEPDSDVEIFGEGYGPDKGISAGLSEDGRYLLIIVWHGSAAIKSEVYFQDVADHGPMVPVVNDIDARFDGEIAGDELFLHTNWKAPNGRILRVDLAEPARENWQEIIPESEAVIRGFSLAGGKLFVNYTRNVSSRLKVFEPDGTYLRDIELPAIGSASTPYGRWQSNEAFFAFSSFHIPRVVYRYDVENGTRDVWSRSNVPINSEMFEVKQVWYQSKDGTQVPMFIVHAKGTKLDGSNPTLLTGYGGFNASLTPWFSARAALWIEAGGVFAQPNLRGGGEFGEEWHKAGMLQKKQNVFDDFIAAAEWLIENGYTRPEKLAISGGSNGGLLVGAAMTQRPELFRAVICSYPLLDMIRYHKFLVARFWVSEYGSAEDPQQFKYIRAYSPYHQVKDGTEYPAVLFITGDMDTRVDPLHARKMAALLQSATGSDRPVLLRYHTKAGHSGGQPLSKQIEDMTDIFSFLSWQLGVTYADTSASVGPSSGGE